MDCFVFNNDTNTLQIEEYSILLVKEFAALWDKDRNKCKDDKTGKNRYRALKELTYMYLMLDFKSPYFQFLEKDRHEAALIDSGLTEEDLKDEVFRAAFHKYQDIQNADPILSLIRTAYRTLFKMQVFLDSIDFNTDVDTEGRPLYKPKDVLADLGSIDKMRTQLMELEAKHRNGLNSSGNKVRGDQTAGLFD